MSAESTSQGTLFQTEEKVAGSYLGKKTLSQLIMVVCLLGVGCKSMLVANGITRPPHVENFPTTIPATRLEISAESISPPKTEVLATPYSTIISSEMTPPHFAETPTPTFTPLPILTPEDAQALVFEGKIAVLTLEQQQPPFNPQGQLQIVDFATQDVLLLSEDVSSYEWAPNGQRLAYSAFSRISGTYELYTVNSDGTELIKLDPPLVGKVDRLSPTWSPDSKQIAFTQPEAGEHLIHIMNADGSNVQFLTKGMWPAWSPDGSMIAFLKSRNGRAAGDIFIIDLATRGLRQLTEDIDAGQPVWSPDGRFIAFYGNQQTNNQSGLFVAQVDGTTAIRIVPEIDWFPVWAPGWSPDSSQVIFAQDGTLYVVQVNSLNILPLELPLGPFYLSGTLSP